MGSGASSLVKKNEIINWYFSNKSWINVGYGLPDIVLKGDLVLRDQSKDENLTKIEKDSTFLKKDVEIGTFSIKNGNLTIKDIVYDNNKNIIFTLNHNNGSTYTLNVEKRSWKLTNTYNTFLQYAKVFVSGNSKLILNELCNKAIGLDYSCNKEEERQGEISIEGGGIQRKDNYNFIINPLTNRKVNINGPTGRGVLNNYIKALGRSIYTLEDLK